MNTEQKNAFSVPASILLGAIIIACAIVFVLHPSSTGTTSPTAQNQAVPTPSVDVKNVKTAGEPFIGNPNAPVTIAYWFDYQCPYCKQNEEDVMPSLLADYVN